MPDAADKWLFWIAPFVVFVPSFMAYLPLAFGPDARGSRTSTPACCSCSRSLSLVPIGVVMAGWASQLEVVAARRHARRRPADRLRGPAAARPCSARS